MQPLPDSRVAARYLHELGGEADALHLLQSVSERAAAEVPALVAASVTVVVDGTPYTLTATAPSLRGPVAVQQLSVDPVDPVVPRGEAIEVADLLDEGAWQSFSATSAAPGVRSSLSLPLLTEDAGPAGAIDLYGSEAEAFTGHRQALATAFGVPLEALVANADLSFETRRQSEQLPGQLSEDDATSRAVEALGAANGWSPEEAGRRLQEAAESAGIPTSRLVKALLTLHRS